MMLIHQGSAPTPQADGWGSLPEDEKAKVFAAYKALNEIPGVTPGLGLQPPETATTVRVVNGATVMSDGPFVELKEAIAGYLNYEADDLDAAVEVAARIPAGVHGRRHRGAADRRVVARFAPLRIRCRPLTERSPDHARP